MPEDPSEKARAAILPLMPALADQYKKAGEETWTTEEFRRDFEAISFLAPFVSVRRRSDGVKGTLMFDHHPRVYFNWAED